MTHVILNVGKEKPLDEIQFSYNSSVDELLSKVSLLIVLPARKYITRTSPTTIELNTNNPLFVKAFMKLSKGGNTRLTIYRHTQNKIEKFDVDCNGKLVVPWPDEFFEIDNELSF